MTKLLQCLFLILPVGLQAQFSYVLEQSIPVKDESGSMIPLAWAGGLNAAHYSTMDINHDGKDDLVLFDRAADKIFTFVNDNNEYRYAPELEDFFPADITNWLLLRDYNCDGKKDIFTGSLFGIAVYINTTSGDGPLSWEKFIFFSGEGKSEALLTTGLSGTKINLQLQFDDLPSITDADGDGDLDIFNLRYAGEGSIEFHRNYSKERYGTCDSLDFEKVTSKWAGLAECDCGEFAFNDADCGATGGRTQHAAGKSLLMLDVDGNASLDILFSEADCSNLYALINEGTTENPVINSYSIFPESSPVNFVIFPAAFYEDIDFDGRRDLISTPNIFAKTPETLNANLSHSNWIYKNTGTDASPVFTFMTDSFLQNQMIDVGDNAVPAFIDYDGDGDKDMFVSQNNVVNSVATVSLYENTGTQLSPEFTLTTRDAFGFSEATFYNLKIQFVDINHDAKTDLVFTATDFLTGQTRLYYIPNKSSSVIDFGGQPHSQTSIQIISSENVLVVDVDSDGYQDLLIGKTNGTLQYWRNQRQSAVSFSLEDETFLEIAPNIFQQNISAAAADLDGDGKTDLILGDQTGVLKIISNFREAQTIDEALTNIIFNSLNNDYKSKNLGGRIWPTTANLFNTNKPAIIVGNALGGVSVLRNDEGTSLPKIPDVVIYSNPANVRDVVYIQSDRPTTMQVFSSLGQIVTMPVVIPANEPYPFKMPFVSAGVYILRFTARDKSVAKRLVLVE
jgi:hypothetical protein